MVDGGREMLSKPACPVGRAKSASGGEDGWLMVKSVTINRISVTRPGEDRAVAGSAFYYSHYCPKKNLG